MRIRPHTSKYLVLSRMTSLSYSKAETGEKPEGNSSSHLETTSKQPSLRLLSSRKSIQAFADLGESA